MSILLTNMQYTYVYKCVCYAGLQMSFLSYQLTGCLDLLPFSCTLFCVEILVEQAYTAKNCNKFKLQRQIYGMTTQNSCEDGRTSIARHTKETNHYIWTTLIFIRFLSP